VLTANAVVTTSVPADFPAVARTNARISVKPILPWPMVIPVYLITLFPVAECLVAASWTAIRSATTIEQQQFLKRNVADMLRLQPVRTAVDIRIVVNVHVVDRLRLSATTLERKWNAVELKTAEQSNVTISFLRRSFPEVTLNAVVRKTVTVSTVRDRPLLTAKLIPTRRIFSAAAVSTVITLNATVT
jgi:hypothetical protein